MKIVSPQKLTSQKHSGNGLIWDPRAAYQALDLPFLSGLILFSSHPYSSIILLQEWFWLTLSLITEAVVNSLFQHNRNCFLCKHSLVEFQDQQGPGHSRVEWTQRITHTHTHICEDHTTVSYSMSTRQSSTTTLAFPPSVHTNLPSKDSLQTGGWASGLAKQHSSATAFQWMWNWILIAGNLPSSLSRRKQTDICSVPEHRQHTNHKPLPGTEHGDLGVSRPGHSLPGARETNIKVPNSWKHGLSSAEWRY